LLDNPYLLEI